MGRAGVPKPSRAATCRASSLSARSWSSAIKSISPKRHFRSGLYNRLIRLAAFQNPEFYKAQAMRLPTYDKPRIIACAEELPRHIGLAARLSGRRSIAVIEICAST